MVPLETYSYKMNIAGYDFHAIIAVFPPEWVSFSRTAGSDASPVTEVAFAEIFLAPFQILLKFLRVCLIFKKFIPYIPHTGICWHPESWIIFPL